MLAKQRARYARGSSEGKEGAGEGKEASPAGAAGGFGVAGSRGRRVVRAPSQADDASAAAAIRRARTKASEPKVFVPHRRVPGTAPRKLEVERRRREFAGMDLEALLGEHGVDYGKPGAGRGDGSSSALPLEAFDSSDFECREPEEWARLGRAAAAAAEAEQAPVRQEDLDEDGDEAEAAERAGQRAAAEALAAEDGGARVEAGPAGVPARAVVRRADGTGTYRRALVRAYLRSEDCFEVEFPAEGGGSASEEGPVALPRVDICFDGEDPRIYAARVGFAHRAREEAGLLLRYHLYIDCMPTDDMPGLAAQQITRVLTSALATPSLRASIQEATAAASRGRSGAAASGAGGDDVAGRATSLLHEAVEDFRRCMNKLVFDRALRHTPHEGLLPLVKLPVSHPALSSDESSVPSSGDGGPLSEASRRAAAAVSLTAAYQKEAPAPGFGGLHPVPAHDFQGSFSRFTFHSFFTKIEAATALLRVRNECSLRLLGPGGFLDTSEAKPSRLEEFLASQEAATRQFSQMLREQWIAQCRSHVRHCLGPVGKGDYNIHESRVETYRLSKLRRLLLTINFITADTLLTCAQNQVSGWLDFIRRACEASVSVRSPTEVVNDFKETSRDEAEATQKEFGRKPLFAVDVTAVEVTEEVVEGDAGEDGLATGIEDAKSEGAGGAAADGEPGEPETYLQMEFSTPLEKLADAPADVLLRGLRSLAGVPQVERLVMDRLLWAHDPTVPSPHPSESWIESAVTEVRDLMQAALVPMEDYRALVDSKYQDLLNMDVDAEIEALAKKHGVDLSGGKNKKKKQAEGDEDEDEEEVSDEPQFDLRQLLALARKHRREAEAVAQDLPASHVTVGPFLVSVSAVRTRLIDTHRKMEERVIDLIALNAQAVSQAIVSEYKAIDKRLAQAAKDIEELTDLKNDADKVPGKVKVLQKKSEDNDACYRSLNELRRKLPRDQFNLQWTVKRWPQLIEDRLEQAADAQAAAQETYLGDMEREQQAFEEHLSSIHAEVQAITAEHDIAKVGAVAQQATKIRKSITDAKEKSQTFNMREMLFGREQTDYQRVADISKQFEPYGMLWETASAWTEQHDDWMNGKFTNLDGEAVEREHGRAFKNMAKAVRTFERMGKQGCLEVAQSIRASVESFKPLVPVVQMLRSPGMESYHWEELAEKILKVDKAEVDPEREDFTLAKCVEMGVEEHAEAVQRLGERAGKEYQIKSALDQMVDAWKPINLVINPYRETGTCILHEFDLYLQLLDEHITTTSAMAFSQFKARFEDRINEWSAQLTLVSDVLDEWIKVQRSWMYLQPIFDSADIQKQLPKEYKRFSTVDKNWRATMDAARRNPLCIEFCNQRKVLERFQESNTFLDLVQKQLSDYLETKRIAFPRFFFLSDSELLDILSSTKDPRAVQDHLKRCFEGLNKVEFGEDNLIVAIKSEQGEVVPCSQPVDPKGKNVEHWMTDLENEMRQSIKTVMLGCIVDYDQRARVDWIQGWITQCVLNGSQTQWTRLIEDRLRDKGAEGIKEAMEVQKLQLADMVTLVRGKLGKMLRKTMSALTVVDVHARDVTARLVKAGVKDENDFEWISQMRYYWHGEGDGGHGVPYELDDEGKSIRADMAGDLFVMMVSSNRPYGYEFIGDTGRLVITPLTDKCYLTLMGALQMNLGGAPAGPAGTGKTETVKDLSKALAKQCVVFNCSDGLNYLAMAKFFKGLASCGAWACFDEFNRIDVEVLSVVAQQLMELTAGVQAGLKSMRFSDTEITLSDGFCSFITMNPGYAGRTELPDNLKALFRPVAMMVPDYGLIGEIMLFSFGFEQALQCARKMVATFKLCSEQLSSQDHYDYGMRAVKTVITAAGNLKRQDPDMDEQTLLYRALQDVNLPKFLAHDLPLFEGIMSDLFPGTERPKIDYGDLLKAITLCTEQHGLQPVPIFLTKARQLYETVVVRHGLMVVGPTGGGKSCIIRVLRDALRMMKAHNRTGPKVEHVEAYFINPKSIKMEQLYGAYDPNTQEWQDGVLAGMVRKCADAPTTSLKWIVFDGPVDAIWIENMNTVLDDNKKLCLNSGEIIRLSEPMTMMFEVEDLAVASPATVSRCGMVYTEPKSLGWDPIVQSWLRSEGSLPECFTDQMRATLLRHFDLFVPGTLYFLRRYLSEPVPSVDNQLVRGLCNVLDTFFEPYFEKEGRDRPTKARVQRLADDIPALFMFSLIWSIACTTNEEGRKRFNAYLRAEMRSVGFDIPLPADGQIYDYCFLRPGEELGQAAGDEEDGAGASGAGAGGASRWVAWMDTVDEYKFPQGKYEFADLIIPTKDSVRYKYLAKRLLANNKFVLMTGPTGTGKTVNMVELLSQEFPKLGNYQQIQLTFSAQTSANQTQDLIDAKMQKRQRGVYGPMAGTYYVLFVDDLNMPQREEYFAQPPIELLRQWCDYQGWYDRKERTFRKIIDTVLLAAMGPPGGGRNPITARMVRQFNMVNQTEMDHESMSLIFGTILRNFLQSKGFDDSIQAMVDATIKSSTAIYETVQVELLPTPSKPHYTFNLRDMGKIFQGMLMADTKTTLDGRDFLRLWVHECRRVFADRLINDQDRLWFDRKLKGLVESEFKRSWDEDVRADGNGEGAAGGGGDEEDASSIPKIIFGDFMTTDPDARKYEEIKDLAKLQPAIEEYLGDYNGESKNPMHLVMFLDAMQHVARIARVLRQPQGNALLLGVGGSGRQSLTRLATFIGDFQPRQVEISKGYGQVEWRDDLKDILMKAGVEEQRTVFIFNDTQIVFESMLEDINSILNSGDVPNLYVDEDLATISSAVRRETMNRGLTPDPINMFQTYLRRVKRNIHVVMCMSPMGDAFRERLRMFPALVNCCTIDWFAEWPDEALQSVGMTAVTGDNDAKLGDHVDSVVEFFRIAHQTVAKSSADYLESLRRYNYVTPTSYLELLNTFKSVLELKREQVGTLRSRLKKGLDALIKAAENVATLQVELTEKQPKLKQKQTEVSEMIVNINARKEAAATTREAAAKAEADASELATNTKAIADDAQADLDKALPALDDAVRVLNQLKKSDLDELRSIKTPGKGVVLAMHAACLLFAIKPKVIKDPAGGPGAKKIKDFWEPAKKELLSNAKQFISDMKEYDKDSIKDDTIDALRPFMDDPNFEPDAVAKSNSAAMGVCKWARAMFLYATIAKDVEPKRRRLAAAQADLDKATAEADKARAELKEVEDELAELNAKYEAAEAEKKQLLDDVQQCEARLERAQKLIGGLGGERDRWTTTVGQLTQDYENVMGDALVAASSISYLGAFTSDFRSRLVEQWRGELKRLDVPHSEGCDLRSTLADPVRVRAWNIAGLPADAHSVENGIIMDQARRWPLMIDPQGQANRYVKNMGKDKQMAPNDMDVLRSSEKKFAQNLENAVRFGKWVLLENIGEKLDALLEPILLQSTFKMNGADMIKLGDSVIPFNDDFQFFMTTKLPNPHYPPEVAVKVSLLNFTITPSGLEDQMLGVFVVNELPELEERKTTLMLDNARMNRELKEIENKILYMLSNADEDKILDDVELIETLAQSKVTSQEIQEQVQAAEATEKEIDETREKYRPVAFRASLLYFAIADLSNIDPMYQYSLPWFTALFVRGIQDSEPAEEDIPKRITNLNSYFTALMYRNVCRSLFERHKLLFSFLLCQRIMAGDGKIDPEEWRFLISGQATGEEKDAEGLPEEPPTESAGMEWVTTRTWKEFRQLNRLPALSGIARKLLEKPAEYREIFDSSDGHRKPTPPSALELLRTNAPEGHAEIEDATGLQRMCILRALRPDLSMLAVQDFVVANMGKEFIEPPPFDLQACYDDSNVASPLIFVLSTGSDPTAAFYAFAEQAGMRSKLEGISLGQGQGPLAARLIEKAQANGEWVLLQNCHLAKSWMPELERTCEAIDPDRVSPDFRLWLTSMPSKDFPVSVLQNGVKMTNEPPKGLRANMRNFYHGLADDDLQVTNKPEAYRKLVFGLAFFHANIQERRKFGPLGWNVPYEFNESDLDISRRQLELFLDEYEKIPFRVLNFLTSYINYGGRVTDDKDLRTIDVILKDYFCAPAMEEGYAFSRSGVYRTIEADEDAPRKSYMDYIDSLPINADPEVFGMHANANITCDQNETFDTFDTLMSLQPRSAAGGGKSRDEIVMDAATDIFNRLPLPFDVEQISMVYPVRYEESMNTVLVQECIRYNKIVQVMRASLVDLRKALKGLVVMSGELDAVGTAMAAQRVPAMWEDTAYPSLKPLAPWTEELLRRLKFIQDWVDGGIPAHFWISGFYFPQAFLTGTLQNYARKHQLPIDTLSFDYNIVKSSVAEITEKPEDGCFIHGLFLEGACFDLDKGVLADSQPKVLYTELPVLHLVPRQHREEPKEGVYLCPVYKILSRRGTLSTTGHSTNFVMWIELPSDRPTITNNVGKADTDYFIKAGVAAFCALRY